MGALNSLRPAARGLVRNPALLLVTGVFTLLQLPQLLLQSWNPLLAAVLSVGLSVLLLVFVPFYQGGLLAMAGEALAGTTDLATFVREGKSNYLALLLGYFLVLAIQTVFGIVAFVGGITTLFVVIASEGEPGLAVYAVVGALGTLLLLAYLVALFFVQFYGHAIVLDDTDAIEGFERSIALVRANLVSALGYSLIMGVGGGAVGIVAGLSSLAFAPERPEWIPLADLSMSVLAVAALVYFAAIALLGAFWATYSVEFYQRMDAPE